MRYFALLIPTLFLAVAAFLTGCDDVDEPYRRPAGSVGASSDTLRTDTLDASAAQNILLEDFTGFRCGNCPAAGRIADELGKDYPGQVHVVKIHATGLASPFGSFFSQDLRTETGDAIASRFAVSAIPTGMINRAELGGKVLHDARSWRSLATDDLEREPEVQLRVHPIFNPEGENGPALDVQFQIDCLKELSPETSVALYVVEDSVVAPQIDYGLDTEIDTVFEFFPHNKTLRGAVNGTFGLPLSQYYGENLADFADENGMFAEGSKLILNVEYLDWNPEWVPKNCKIIAVLHNQGDSGDPEGRVLQVASYKVTTP